MSKTGREIGITEANNGFGAAEVRTIAGRRAQVWGTMRDAECGNAGEKAALEALSPRIAIAGMQAFIQPRHVALLMEIQHGSVPCGADA